MVLRIPVTANEHAAITGKADQTVMSVSGFVRSCALDEPIPVVIESTALNADEQAQLKTIGIKINDIAKAMNTGRDDIPHSLEDTCNEFGAILDTLAGRK